MRPSAIAPWALVLLLSACRTAAPAPEVSVNAGATNDSYVAALREEFHALRRIQSVLGWYVATQGEPALGHLTYVGHDRLFEKRALDAVAAAAARRGLDDNEKLALEFLGNRLTGRYLALSTVKLDDELTDAEASATVVLPWREQPVAYRDLRNLIAREPDRARRDAAYAAATPVLSRVLNPLLLRKEAAAQRAAKEIGAADYVALSERLRDVKLPALLASGVAYLRATDGVFQATLDRVAREEIGVPRQELRYPDMERIFKSGRLAAFFPLELELKALSSFLGGIGLDLHTAAGTEVRIDDSLLPRKVPRAFVNPVAPPGDVRLSVKPTGGLDDYWTLFHEAGHAVHFASATIQPAELVQLGYGAPSEAYGEFFRHAFSDPRFLVRYRAFLAGHDRPAPTDGELASILRHTALVEMWYLRRYAFAKVAYELRLHGRPASEIAPALAELPADARFADDLRGLYRALFSRAYGFALTADDAERYLSDVDDTFYSADYARAFVLAGQLQQAVRAKFGDDWSGNAAVGRFLREQLFSRGTSLSPEDVARRIGAQRVDFDAAAERAHRLAAAADALEKGS